MKFRKRPVVIEAFQYGIDPRPNWFDDKVTTSDIVIHCFYCEIKTLEGIMVGNMGDYIIQGVKGECYPCKSDIFELTYEKVEERTLQDSIQVNKNLSFGLAL